MLRQLEAHADAPAFWNRWRAVMQTHKNRLADHVRAHTGIELDPSWMFDIQVKRIHEYKRQHLNVLHIATLYRRLKEDPQLAVPPHAFIFGGKAAPGYFMAKRIIKLIHAVAETVNADPDVNTRIKVAFVPNSNVQNAHLIYPAADLSEQISTAGKEASGTGNMKFMMNGALTIGTLDGANVEMHRQVGDENIFLFGLTADEVKAAKQQGYKPYEYYTRSPDLKRALDQLSAGFVDGVSYADLAKRLLFGAPGTADEYMLLADFDSYRRAQALAGETYLTRQRWNQMALINIARSGVFAADRSIREYARNIWDVPTRG
jgi:starch phosphorylase